MVLLLNESEVTSLLKMDDTLQIVEDALRDYGEGKAVNYPRYRLTSLDSVLNVMSAGIPRLKSSGLKVYGVSRIGLNFLVLLMDAVSGDWLSIMSGNRLGQMRTGAASGVATKYLARKDSKTLGIFGSGWQARSQIEAISKVRNLEQVRCYSPNYKHAAVLATEVREKTDLEIEAVQEPQKAAHRADIIVTATGSKEPVVMGDWLAEGVHLNGIGANDLRRRELDSDVIARCDHIFVDSIEQSKIESGDLAVPVSEGLLDWNKVHELGKLVAGRLRGRSTPKEITLFKSNGIAIEDVAVAKHLYELATSGGVGKNFELFK